MSIDVQTDQRKFCFEAFSLGTDDHFAVIAPIIEILFKLHSWVCLIIRYAISLRFNEIRLSARNFSVNTRLNLGNWKRVFSWHLTWGGGRKPTAIFSEWQQMLSNLNCFASAFRHTVACNSCATQIWIIQMSELQHCAYGSLCKPRESPTLEKEIPWYHTSILGWLDLLGAFSLLD